MEKRSVLYLPFIIVFLLISSSVNTISASSGTPVVPEKVLPYKLFDLNIPLEEDSLQLEKGSADKFEKSYAFPDLDAQIQAAIDEVVETIPPDPMDDLSVAENQEEIEGKKAIEAAKLGGTRIDNFDDLLDIQLPAYRIQKIGNLEAIIVINSLRLNSEPEDGLSPGGRIGIYVGIKIPQKNYDSQGRKKNVTLIFGTEALGFTKEGGIKVGNIRLVNDVFFELGGSSKKAIIELNKGDFSGAEAVGTYIKFGCNGVEEFGIAGKVHFSKEWVTPVVPDPATGERVTAEIQIIVQDWNNMLITTSIEKFSLTKFKEVKFELRNCTVDLSDFRNPPNMKFPDGYANNGGETSKLWRGVYIELFEFTFPDPFKKKCDGNYGNQNDPANPNPGCSMTASAKDLIIDRSGVTGTFSISGQAPLASGALLNSKWNWSLDEVNVDVYQSKFTGFGFSGGMVIPITKKETPFAYTASIDFGGGDGLEEQTPTYNFTVQPEKKVEFPLFKGFNVELEPNSIIDITVENNEFKPSAILYGKMSIGKASDSPTGDEMQVAEITFKKIKLQTEGPFISAVGGGVFISAPGAKLNNFPIQISGIGIGFGENTAHLDFNLGISLMKQSDGGLSSSGSFSIHGKLITNVIGAHQWKYDKFTMSGFALTIDLPLFKGTGSLNIFKDDPVYGKGFSATLDAEILGGEDGGDSKFSLEMAAVFGNVNGMRYFMVDGFVGSDAISIPLPPTPLSMNGFGGGVQYRMKLAGYHEPAPNSNSTALPIGVDASGLIYEPDPGTLFGIKFAVGLTTTGTGSGGSSPITGKLSCIIRFGQGLSLQNITFWGTAEMINPVGENNVPEVPDVGEKVPDLAMSDADMHKKDLEEVEANQDKIVGKVGISLDFDGGFSFHGYAEVNIKAAEGKLTGRGQLDLLIAPKSTTDYPSGRWHLYLGGYDNGAVTVPDFFNPENEIVLYPNHVSINYGGLSVVAKAYFLLGNDIPGPPPLNAEAANYFKIPTTSNAENREVLYCNGNSPAKGTGIALGASLSVKFEKKIRKKILFAKVTIVNIKAYGAAGFDIALLKYGPETYCSGGSPGDTHGVNGFRATGNVWAFVDVSGKILGVRLPGIGLGVLLQADMPDPSFFRAVAVLKFIKRWSIKFDIGEECGHPCSVVED